MRLFSRRERAGALSVAVVVLGSAALLAGLFRAAEASYARDAGASRANLSALQDAFAAIADDLEPAVVTITSQRTVRPSERIPDGEDSYDPPTEDSRSPRAYRAESMGSGVIISKDGWVLTNDHVTNGADKVRVKLHDGREIEGVVRRDFRSDLALVKMSGDDFPFARLGDSDRVKVGHWAIAIGSPYRYEGSFSVGVVSSLYRRQEITDGAGRGRLYPNMIQTDAAINPGNSGGPLVNLDGEVIGINTAIESPNGRAVGIGFAIPINAAKFVVEQLESRGHVTYGYLGVEPESVTPRLAGAYKVTGGALVLREPLPGSPAQKAGIHVEDVITEIDGKPIRGELDLRTLVARIPPQTTVDIKLVRAGQEQTVKVTVEKSADAAEPSSKRETAGRPSMGLLVNALTAEAAARAGLDRKTQGVVVKAKEEASAVADTEIKRDDVILRVNDVPTPTVDAFQKVTASLHTGDLVRIVWQGKRLSEPGVPIVRRVTIITLD